MDTAHYILLSLLSFLLLLATLNLVFYVWSKITLIFLILLHLATYKLKLLKKSTLSLFGRKSETQSDSMTIDWSDLEILSDSLHNQGTAPHTSIPPKCAPLRQSKNTSSANQKRDSKGRFTKV